MLEEKNTVMPARPKVRNNMGKCPTLVMAEVGEEEAAAESNRLQEYPEYHPKIGSVISVIVTRHLSGSAVVTKHLSDILN